MAANFDKLDSLVKSLQEYLKELDYEKLDQCDEEIRKEIEYLTSHFPDDESLPSRIDNLRQTYQQMVESTTLVRDKLGSDLRQLTKDNRAIKQYLQMNSRN